MPEEDLLDALRQFADQIGRTPTMREMRDRGPHSSSVYAERFGSWFEAIEAAELDPDARHLPRIPTEELLDELRRLADELDHSPTRREMRRYGNYSDTTYVHRFGSWSDALSEVDLTTHRPGLQPQQRRIIEKLREAEQ